MLAVNETPLRAGGRFTRQTTARIPRSPEDLSPENILPGRRISRNWRKLRRRGQPVDGYYGRATQRA